VALITYTYCIPQAIYSFNLPYSVAVHTAGSETNVLKLGSQQGENGRAL
jgi:hypothetical protein